MSMIGTKTKGNLEVAMFQNSSYSLPKEMIVWHVTENQNNNKLYSVTPPAKRSCQTTPRVSPIVTDDSINLPTPENGIAYTKSEVVNIMSKVPVGDVHSRAATIKVILEHQKKYSVPCS